MKHTIIALLIFSSLYSSAQEMTQTIRGTLVDLDSQSPLIGATVQIIDSDPLLGAITDINGEFRIENVSVGRVSLLITYIGYEEKVIPNILVNAAKEVVLNIPLQESFEKLDEVVVTAKKNKAEVLNEMALVSARSFSVEETQRYAGSISDPARMVASFAGVTGNAEGNNDIVVRGNSSKGILWKLEGIEIPNPNHFANDGATGGPVNSLNANMLGDSDFFSGAFAPEYGNALSGVFDMKFKKGNNEQREYTTTASIFGIDFTAEGPFKKGYNGSYIANYRYSSLQLLSDFGIVDFGGIPKYQDASFKVNLPLSENQHLSIFGLGGLSSIYVEDTDDNGNDEYRGSQASDLGIIGVSHTIFTSKNTFVKNTISAQGTQLEEYYDLPEESTGFFRARTTSVKKGTYRVASTLNHKINAQHKIETGFIYSQLTFNAQSDIYNFEREVLENVLSDDGSSNTLQAYSSWKYRLNEKLTMNSGLHYMHFGLANSHSVEPRVAMKWELSPTQSISAGAGLHSKIESISIYKTKEIMDDGTTRVPNKNLQPSKAAHFVLGYDKQVNAHTHFKMEAYYQHLYDVPVEDLPESTYSLLNSTDNWEIRPLSNTGKGRNYGLEFTMERYLHRGFYYMSTLSLYQSRYTASDGVERNTAFNGNYVFNLLGGKEFAYGKATKNKVFFVNIKTALIGGSRYTPIDLNASIELGDEVRFEDQPYSKKGDDIFFINLSIGTRKNKRNTTREFKIDINNITNNQGKVNEYYVDSSQAIEGSPQLPFLPNIVYSLKF
ncbi:MAG: TonB-dependent receptor [Cyclobacteriaceae bacterium]